MHQETRIVFDETLVVASASPVLYPSLEHTDFLGAADQLALQAVLFTASPGGFVHLEVRIQQSADGRNWLAKNTAPELSGTIQVQPGSVASIAGGESWPARPRLRFVRLQITVTAREVTASVRFVLHATARTRTTGPTLPTPSFRGPPARRAAMATLLGIHPATLAEVHAHVRQGGERNEQDAGQVFAKLSPAARADVLGVTHFVTNLDPDNKRMLLLFAGALTSLLLSPAGQGAPVEGSRDGEREGGA